MYWWTIKIFIWLLLVVVLAQLLFKFTGLDEAVQAINFNFTSQCYEPHRTQ